MFKKIWDFCGEVKVTFWLLLIISINLAAGSYYIKYNPQLFNPLNQSLIQDWFKEYGRYQPGNIWWFGLLLALILFLGVNTIVCALKRVFQLWPRRNQLGLKVFLVKITPSFIHICFLIMLSGHFLSLIIGFHQVFPVKPDQKILLPDGSSLEVISQSIERYQAPTALKGLIRQCSVFVKIQGPGKTEIKRLGILHPLHRQGLSIHLDTAGNPNPAQIMTPPKMKLIIKKDPGRPFIITGFLVLCLLMLWYFPQRKKS